MPIGDDCYVLFNWRCPLDISSKKFALGLDGWTEVWKILGIRIDECFATS
jgi:hypothetical protein